jgi:hypothetical protein
MYLLEPNRNVEFTCGDGFVLLQSPNKLVRYYSRMCQLLKSLTCSGSLNDDSRVLE